MCLAIPGEIVEVRGDGTELATVDVGGVRRVINIGLLGEQPPGAGDWVLIHVGFALSAIDEQEAKAVLELLESVGQAYADELDALNGTDVE